MCIRDSYDIKQLGKQLKKLGMLIVQDQVWNRVTINRAQHLSLIHIFALGAGLAVWGVVSLVEGSGNDNPGAKSQGIKQLMAGGGVVLIGTTLIPVSYTHLDVYKRQMRVTSGYVCIAVIVVKDCCAIMGLNQKDLENQGILA